LRLKYEKVWNNKPWSKSIEPLNRLTGKHLYKHQAIFFVYNKQQL